jgi:hypothetical protein
MTRTEIETWLAGPGRKHVEAAAAEIHKRIYVLSSPARQLATHSLTAFLTSMLEDGTARVSKTSGFGYLGLQDKVVQIPAYQEIIIKLEAQ